MSKVDAQRAMREARYAAMQAQTPHQTARRPAQSAATPETPAPTRSTKARRVETPAEELCGHRGSGGKPCTRPAKHPEKSHRYA